MLTDYFIKHPVLSLVISTMIVLLGAQAFFNTQVRQLLADTDQLHDGRWLWIRVRRPADVKSIKDLLKIKRKPKKVEPSNGR